MIRVYLDQLDELFRWAHSDAYQPVRVDRDTSRGIAPPPSPDANPDWIYGRPDDFGIGNHRRRTAYRASLEQFARCEVMLAWAERTCCGPNLATYLTHPRPHDELARIVRDVNVQRHRLDRIDRRWTPTAQHPVDEATRFANLAVDTLNRVFLEGRANPHTQAVEDRCVNFNVGCPNEREHGYRCWACYRYFNSRGVEKPAALFKRDVAQANAAKARRVLRGDGWADESASCTNPVRPPDKEPA